MQPVDDPERYKTNPQPKWEVRGGKGGRRMGGGVTTTLWPSKARIRAEQGLLYAYQHGGVAPAAESSLRTNLCWLHLEPRLVPIIAVLRCVVVCLQLAFVQLLKTHVVLLSCRCRWS